MEVNTITVLGANGTMGTNISGIFSSFGNAKVYMVSRDKSEAKLAVARAVKSVRADSIAERLIPADYSMIETCVSESDIVFESVAEDLEVKLEITKQISGYLNDHAIIASGTSGLSITKLAEALPEKFRERYFGVHMFNPPYNLTLCELAPTVYSDRQLFDDLKQYLADVLHRTVVEVKDSPAFLGNRIGFMLINRALQCSEEYKDNGGIDYLDAVLGTHSGRSMAPLVTSDFVGLDVHKAIVDNIRMNVLDYAHESFIMPGYAEKLIREGHLGHKTKCGLYKTEVLENGTKRRLVYDITSDDYRQVIRYSFPFAEKMRGAIRIGDYQEAFSQLINNRSLEAELCLKFLLEYIIYALHTAADVGYDIRSADDVMGSGFNWCPPMAMVEALSLVCDIEELMKRKVDSAVFSALNVERLMEMVVRSRYDYRPYFKSK